MRVIVTCGPSYEPIDSVRRLTNFSTGELGLLLSARLAEAGHQVLCLKGSGATALPPEARIEIQTFTTNDDLLWKLQTYAGKADFLFHTAALCDYRVQQILRPDGTPIPTSAKLATRDGAIHLALEPTTKVLPQLRALYPKARLVGWKYELDGNRDDVLAKAARQLAECSTDACVVNGHAWGPGFGFVTPQEAPVSIPDKSTLCDFLAEWMLPAAPPAYS
jgi:phosphopantothenoylcysteine synthetase/decarboxylase